MVICEREEYLKNAGIDTEIVCAGCSEDGKDCTALYELLVIVDKAKELREVGE